MKATTMIPIQSLLTPKLIQEHNIFVAYLESHDEQQNRQHNQALHLSTLAPSKTPLWIASYV